LNILVVTQYFWPENFRINDLVADFKSRGHQVDVLTGIPNYPEGNFFDGYGLFNRRQESFEGVKVFRVPIVSRGKSKGLRLALNFFSFAFSASLLGPFYCKGRYDAIFVFEPSPITVCLPAIVLKLLGRGPVFFWVLDLWPETLSATGAVKSRAILAAVRGLVRFIYSQCDKILVSSKGFASQVASLGFNSSDTHYFPNWVEDVYWEKPRDTLPAVIGRLPEGFKIVFAGNIGSAQCFEALLGAAEILKRDPSLQWLIIGDGRMADWVKGEVRRRGLGANFHMLGRHTPETVVDISAKSDALLVSLRPDPVFALTVPGKIQSYLACGKPIIASLDGEGAELVKESGAGIACPAGDANALAEAVRTLAAMPCAEREKMGAQGLKFCRENFTRARLVDSLEGWIMEVAKKYN
jgi:glycosyltransferase involved in cell wall biosynthesis